MHRIRFINLELEVSFVSTIVASHTMADVGTWEESWPEAEEALKQAAAEHAAVLSKARSDALSAQRRARAAEVALRALPAAVQRAEVAEASLREMQVRLDALESGRSPPGKSQALPSTPTTPPAEGSYISPAAAALSLASAMEEATAAEEATLAGEERVLGAEISTLETEVSELRRALGAAELASEETAANAAAASAAAEQELAAARDEAAAARREAARATEALRDSQRALSEQVGRQLETLGSISRKLVPLEPSGGWK